MEVVEGWVERVADGEVFIDVEALVEGLIHQSAGVVVGVAVHRVGVGQDIEGLTQHSRSGGEFGSRGQQPFFGFGAFGLDLAEPGFDLVLREGAVGGEIEQAFFLSVEVGQTRLGCGVHGADAALLVGQR
ncbi:hypothetical protein WGA77_09205 [Nocardia seriolae]|uniref:hypothetical protein n=1 Tax=Nocardia seriolae TaxID=37332 RepID=UPI0030CF1DDF